MMRRFHDLRKHEEGQALVLAAISMLILALCVLATVNLTYAVHHKEQLQDAADSVAYTTAAYQARALNFFAYTNRAMVVQYCAQMNMMAIFTYLMFAVAILTLLEFLTSWIPGVDAVMAAIVNVAKIALTAINVAIAIFIPIIDIINYFTGLVQFAVSTDMLARVVAGPSAELARINATGNHHYVMDPISSTLLGVDAAVRWEQTVLTTPLPNFAPPTQPEDQFDRAMMTEIANSGRHEWTAYGGPPAPFPEFWKRHFNWSVNLVIAQFDFKKLARTEWGSFKPGGGGLAGIWGFLQGITSKTEQIYSVDEFDFDVSVPFFGQIISFSFGAWARADRQFWQPPHHQLYARLDACPGHPCNWRHPWNCAWQAACKAVLQPLINAGLNQLLAAGLQAATTTDIPIFHFGMAPYARFRPGRQTWNRPSGSEMFNQPPVVLLVTDPTSDIVAGGRPFMRSFNVQLGGLSSANSKLMAESGNSFSQPNRGWHSGIDFRPAGLSVGFLPNGFHALAAAQAYYHRPGDWREPPNLFNPFWGAKLMPVVDYPAIGGAPVIGPLLAQKLLVH